MGTRALSSVISRNTTACSLDRLGLLSSPLSLDTFFPSSLVPLFTLQPHLYLSGLFLTVGLYQHGREPRPVGGYGRFALHCFLFQSSLYLCAEWLTW